MKIYNLFFKKRPSDLSPAFNRFVLSVTITSITIVLLLIVTSLSAQSQNNSLVINNAYIKLNGGTSSSPVYLVVNQCNTQGISRNGGWIISEGNYNYIKWNAGTSTGNYIYPFGYSTTDYLPFTFNKTTSTSSNISASTWATNNQNVPHAGISDGGTVPACYKMTGSGDSITSVIDRWWDIYATASVTANLTFSYRGSENTTSMPTDIFQPQHWNGTNWDAPVGSGNTGISSGIGTVTASGVSVFSPYVLVRSSIPLPIELISFTGTDKGNYNLLEWKTASEINNDYFTLERSFKGIDWDILTIINGAGNSTSILHYASNDESPYTPITYYRLKQTDFNGTLKYSQIISIGKENISDSQNFNAYYNTEAIVITIDNKEAGILKVFNSIGQLIFTKKINEGITNDFINTNNWYGGIYFVVLENSEIKTKKLLVFK